MYRNSGRKRSFRNQRRAHRVRLGVKNGQTFFTRTFLERSVHARFFSSRKNPSSTRKNEYLMTPNYRADN